MATQYPQSGPSRDPQLQVPPDPNEEGYDYKQHVSIGDTHEDQFWGNEIIKPNKKLSFERDIRVQEFHDEGSADLIRKLKRSDVPKPAASPPPQVSGDSEVIFTRRRSKPRRKRKKRSRKKKRKKSKKRKKKRKRSKKRSKKRKKRKKRSSEAPYTSTTSPSYTSSTDMSTANIPGGAVAWPQVPPQDVLDSRRMERTMGEAILETGVTNIRPETKGMTEPHFPQVMRVEQPGQPPRPAVQQTDAAVQQYPSQRTQGQQTERNEGQRSLETSTCPQGCTICSGLFKATEIGHTCYHPDCIQRRSSEVLGMRGSCVIDPECVVSRPSSTTHVIFRGQPRPAHVEIQTQTCNESAPFYNHQGFGLFTPDGYSAPRYEIETRIDIDRPQPVAQQGSLTALYGASASTVFLQEPRSVPPAPVHVVERRTPRRTSAVPLPEKVVPSTPAASTGRTFGTDMTIDLLPPSEIQTRTSVQLQEDREKEIFDQEVVQRLNTIFEASARRARRALGRRRQQFKPQYQQFEQQYQLFEPQYQQFEPQYQQCEPQFQQYEHLQQWLEQQSSSSSTQGEVANMRVIPQDRPPGKVVDMISECFRAMDEVACDDVYPDLARDRGGVRAVVSQQRASLPLLGSRMEVPVQRPELAGLTSTCTALESITGMLQDAIPKNRQLLIGDTLRLVPAGSDNTVSAYVIDAASEEGELDGARKKRRRKKKKKKKKKGKKKKRKKKKKKGKKKKKRKKKRKKKKKAGGGGESSPTTATLSSASVPSTTPSVPKASEKVGDVKSDAKTVSTISDLKSLTSLSSWSRSSQTSVPPAARVLASITTLASTGSQVSRATQTSTSGMREGWETLSTGSDDQERGLESHGVLSNELTTSEDGSSSSARTGRVGRRPSASEIGPFDSSVTSTSVCSNCGSNIPLPPAVGQPLASRFASPRQHRRRQSRSSGRRSRGRSPLQQSSSLVENDWSSPEVKAHQPRRRRTRSRSRSSRLRRRRSPRNPEVSEYHTRRRRRRSRFAGSSSDGYSRRHKSQRSRRRLAIPYDIHLSQPILLQSEPPIALLERPYTEPEVLRRPGRPMYASPLSALWGPAGSYPFPRARSYEISPPKLPRYIYGFDAPIWPHVQAPAVVESEVSVRLYKALHETAAQIVPRPTAPSVVCPPQKSLPHVTQSPAIQPQRRERPLASTATTALPVVQPSPTSLAQLPMPPTPIYPQSQSKTVPYSSLAPLLRSSAWNQSLHTNITLSGTFSTDDTFAKTTIDTPPSSSCMSSGSASAELHSNQSSEPWWSPSAYVKRMSKQGNVVITFIFLVAIVVCVVAILSRFGAGPAPHVHDSIDDDDDDESRVMHGPWMNETGGGASMESYRLCRTLECRREGLYLKSLVDSKEACRNFYDSVCARIWKKPDYGTLSSADVMVNDVESSIISYIKAGNVKDRIVEGAKNLWKECMDAETIKKLGKRPFVGVLNKVGLDGWPYVLAANVTGKSVWNVSGTMMRLLSLSTFLTFVVEPVTTSNSASVTIGKGPLEISATYAHDSDAVEGLFQRIKQTLNLLDAQSEIDEIVNDILEFSRTISNQSGSNSDKVAADNQTEFQTFVSSALSGILDLSNGTSINIHHGEAVQELYQKIQSTPPRTVLNYLGYAVVDNLWVFSPQVYLSREQIRAREHNCIRLVERALPKQVHYLGYLSTKHHLDVVFFTGLAHDIKHQVIHSIRDLPWMDTSTKTNVVKRLSNMRMETFFPRWMIYNHTRPKVSQPGFTPLEALVSYQAIMQNTFKDSIKATAMNEDDLWMGSVFDQDCRYDKERNMLFLPLSMANTTKGATQLFLYFHIPHFGVQLARCLLETLDSSRYANVWREPTVRKFANVRKCFEELYLSSTVRVQHPSKRPPSITTGDVLEYAAIIQAHNIFTSRIRKLSKNFQDYRLENAKHLSAEQLFYIYYTAGKCQVYDTKYRMTRHGTPKLVNLVLSHDSSFHKAFNCTQNTIMNPMKKCHFWRL
ncbi:uncharacterized protein LOC135370458 [Ornithodoros turicata]|uniref:uncharacterized protein LOC135370458 n=1 Tax=Ornithodoros turicata TaxID=34597 RepID=UPI003139896D